jgi:hypothetical protein
MILPFENKFLQRNYHHRFLPQYLQKKVVLNDDRKLLPGSTGDADRALVSVDEP